MNKFQLDDMLCGPSFPSEQGLSRRGRRAQRLAQLRWHNVVNTIDYKNNKSTGDTSRGPSPAIWGDCPTLELIEKPDTGIYYFDDFLDLPIAPTETTQAVFGRYKVYNTGSGTVKSDPTLGSTVTYGGIMGMDTDTDNDSSFIASHVSPFLLSTTAGGKLWFEARMATTQIVTNDAQLFVGLGETNTITLSASVPLANANAVSNTGALIGFNRLEDGLGVLNASYSDRGTSWTDVKTTVGSIAALTWVKVGMVFDRTLSAKCVKFFVDGVESSSYISAATLLACTYLDAQALGLVAGMYADSAGTASHLYLDWWGCAQLSA